MTLRDVARDPRVRGKHFEVLLNAEFVLHRRTFMSKRLGVGFIGSGFFTTFHLQLWAAVRDEDTRRCPLHPSVQMSARSGWFDG